MACKRGRTPRIRIPRYQFVKLKITPALPHPAAASAAAAAAYLV